MKILTKKLFGVALGLFNIGLVSNFSVSALPKGCLVYFVGKERVADKTINANSLYNKNCCKCGKNLAERCGQFICDQNCARCAVLNCCFKDKQDALDKTLGEGCKHKKERIYEKVKSDGCFCFIKSENGKTSTQSLEYAKNNNELYCAYCMRSYLVKNCCIFDTNLNQLPNGFSDYVCAICLDKIGNKSLSHCKECNQWFHDFCLSKWRFLKDSCPWCKKPGVKDCCVVPKNMSNIPENDFILSSAFNDIDSCADCSEEDDLQDLGSQHSESFDSADF